MAAQLQTRAFTSAQAVAAPRRQLRVSAVAEVERAVQTQRVRRQGQQGSGVGSEVAAAAASAGGLPPAIADGWPTH